MRYCRNVRDALARTGRATIGSFMMGDMNDESLERVNAFLEAVAARTSTGDVLDVTPAEIGRDLGFPDALSTARAVRALIARKRLEPARARTGCSIRRPWVRRSARRSGDSASRGPSHPGGAAEAAASSYSDVGRAAVDRMIELGQGGGRSARWAAPAREEAR